MTGYRLREIVLGLLGVALLGAILTVRSCRQTQGLQARRTDLETLSAETRQAYADGDPARAARDPRDGLGKFDIAEGEGGAPKLLVNVNAAGEAELQRLPGVGPARAADIIAKREELGGFRAVSDLLQVKGIGEKTLAKMEPEISLGDGAPAPGQPRRASAPAPPARRPSPAASAEVPANAAAPPPPAPRQTIPPPTPVAPPAAAAGPVNINTAGVQDLMRLSGIGEKKAQDIIEYRRLNGPFVYASDITKVKGIGPKTFAKNQGMIVVR